jgi:tape measure domain-containing protein
MAVIDDKVVAMSFESGKFESGVNSTLSSLDKLKAALKFNGASKGLEEVSANSRKIDLSHIGRSVDALTQKFSAFSVATLAIFATIAAKAVQTGAQVLKSFTLDPLISGYQEYATNLNSIQTILANTEASGATLKDVNAALLELNKYSDQTIYNFSQMAKNIGTFTAAGVDLTTSTASIKGIANLAALSGSNAEQASTAMYQLSQAISAGSVKLQDWNSVVNAGMGGTVFQRALAQTATAMGKLDEGALKLSGSMKTVTIDGKSFRESLSTPGKASWLTSDVLTKTLQQFTGDLTDAQLKAEGFNDAQIKAIQQTAKTARFAATEVKTLSQVLDVAKETAGSGWAQTWQIVFGDFGEAKKTFTELSNAINGVINKNAEARNKLLADWKALGGRAVLIDSIKIAFKNLGLILQPIKEAFRDIFPAKTGQDLYDLTLQFKAFAKALKPSQRTLDNLKRTFAGIFSVLDIGKQIVVGVFTFFKEFFKVIGGGSGGFLSFTANIGDFLVALDNTLKKGNKVNQFFVGLAHIIAAPIEAIKVLARLIGDLFSGFSAGGISNQVNGFSDVLAPLEIIAKRVDKALGGLLTTIRESGIISSILDSMGSVISGLGQVIENSAQNLNFELILNVIKTGFFGALVLMFKQFLGQGSLVSQIATGFSGGILTNISGVLGGLNSLFGGLTGSMKAFQQNIKAKTMKEIAIAIALLAASLLAISFIDPKKLNSSLGALTILFGELIAAMALLNKVTASGGFLKLPLLIGGLVGLAVAIDLLTLAVLAMSRLSWDDLLKGLAGVGGLLASLALAAKPLSASSAGMIRVGASIILLAVGLRILANAVQAFSKLSWEELAKGLIGVASGLAAMTAAMSKMPLIPLRSAVGIIALAGALKILASAVSDMAKLSWRELARGLAGTAGALGAIVLAMRTMPKNVAKNAAGVLILAGAMKVLAGAVEKLGSMSLKEIGKGLAALGGALGLLVLGLSAMTGTVAGSIALGIAATSLSLLVPALVLLGKQSWDTIIKGLVGLGATLAVLGVAGLLLGPVAPSLLAVAAATVLFGAGLALAGAGVFLFATGLSALSVVAPAAIGTLIAAFKEWLNAIPQIAESFAQAVLSLVSAFADAAPKFVDAIVKIIDSLLDVIIKSAPKMAVAITALIQMLIKVIRDNLPKIIVMGVELIFALLKGIKANIGQVVTMVADIIVTFINALAKNIGRIVTAGADLIVSFLQGVAKNLTKIIAAAGDIIVSFINGISANIGKIVSAGADLVVNFIRGVSSNILKVVNAGGDAIIKFIAGIGNKTNDIITAGVDVIISFIEGLTQNAVRLANAAGEAIVQFIRGLRIAVETYAPQIRTESAKLGYAIIDGMTFGLLSKAGGLYATAKSIADKALSFFKLPFKINSPSLVMKDLGKSIVEGMVLGLDSNARDIYSSATAMSNGVIDAFNTTFDINSPSRVMMEIGQYVGQGFAQGLRGSQDHIVGAFRELNDKLTSAMVTAKETIAREQERIDKLRKEKEIDTEAIRKAQAIIDANESLLQRSTAGRKLLLTTLKSEKAELIDLQNEYERVGERIKLAEDALKDAKRTRDAAFAEFKDKYSETPEIPEKLTEEIKAARDEIAAAQDELNKTIAEGGTPEAIASAQAALDQAQASFATLIDGKKLDKSGNSVDQLATYMDALKNQTAAVGAYASTLEQLRKLGLDDATYQKLLREGTADQSFANQLLAGGKTAVQGLNKLDSQLMRVSTTLATRASRNLYQAGVDAAAGLLRGLESKEDELHKAIVRMADDIVNTLRAKLKIKSPSKVFEQIGRYSMEGLAIGFRNSSNTVTGAVEDAARDALTSMGKTMRELTSIVDGEMNINPVITPILDLTQVRTQSGELANLTRVAPITATTSYGQASIISAQAQEASSVEDTATALGGPSIKFEQINNSPKALSEIEIYRQTQNQLSQLKSVLTTK